MASDLRIGIDFDNTIVTYDEVFCMAAKRFNLVEATFFGTKQSVRDAIRQLPDGEMAWRRLQGHVYGKGIAEARMVSGFKSFLSRCHDEGAAVAVVSHKTEFGHFDPDRINLRVAALDWMKGHDLFDGKYGLSLDKVYFEGTRAEKIKRIASLSLTHFVDDLEEVLSDPDFPPAVTRILYTGAAEPAMPAFVSCSTWCEIEEQVFNEAKL